VPWSHDPSMFASQRRRAEGIYISLVDMSHLPLSDSWVEVTSRPSSSSLASDIPRRFPEGRSRSLRVEPSEPRATSATGSSQDEYEESSSDSDPVLSSSNEDVKEDDDDKTALGVRNAETVFTPQPNAFSHPPSRHDSYFPQVASTPASLRQSRPHLQRQRTSASYQPDHDAALRASLTTLLSCAAAVRPKEEKTAAISPPRRPLQQPSLRLVQDPVARPVKQVKRKSRESSKERSAKKLRSNKVVPVDEPFSPFAGWIISAGVIFVFSALSFSAGYYMGKIDGRIEGQAGMATGGREVIKGSRAVNWTRGNSIAAY
jgi:hypothetical protein